jgi:transposase
MLPNKPRGVARVDDRRVLNGIFWVLQCGAPWRDLPGSFGPYSKIHTVVDTNGLGSRSQPVRRMTIDVQAAYCLA